MIRRMIERAGNRYLMLNKEIRLHEVMKLIPEDEIVIVGFEGDETEGAVFNGEVGDYWKIREEQELAKLVTLHVVRMETGYTEDTEGAVIMITVR